uniref:Fibronectin type III domain containing 11 n=1 Tax=Molossus molossus TaxID=27622 RepID=A0A7J8HG87_MOLMO|nr:fibronectin type III domain containing 11 [Molossus molossus]
MSFQVTGLGLDKMKLDSPQSFLDLEEVEEAEGRQLLEPEAWRTYTARRNALREFLTSDLSPHLLKRHHARVELLRKCSYHIEILPKHLALGDQNPLVLPSTMFQLVDPWKFQRMKKVGTAQTKIQLLLLGHLLEQLDQGRAQLDSLLESPDPRPFLAGWALVEQRLADLSAVMDNFLAMMVPGRLHIKHRLVSDVGATKIPHIRLMLSTKMPVMFDRKESVAHQDWVALRWFVTTQPGVPEQFELRFKLLDPRTQQEYLQRGIIPVAACTFDVHNLLPNRVYKFTVKRAESYTLVYESWRDSLTLQTRPGPPEGPTPSRLGRQQPRVCFLTPPSPPTSPRPLQLLLRFRGRQAGPPRTADPWSETRGPWHLASRTAAPGPWPLRPRPIPVTITSHVTSAQALAALPPS